MSQTAITTALDVAAATPRKVRTPPIKRPAPTAVAVQVPGLGEYATICALEKALKALKEEHYAPVEAAVTDLFIADGTKIKKRPANFTGAEGDATASCELKQRGSNSELTPIEIALLAKHGISTRRIGIPETVRINPAYADNVDLLRKVSKKLAKLGLPEDFFEIQESSSKTVVADTSLDEVFKKRPQVAADLLKVVGTVALKTKVESVPNALKKVTKLLTPAKAAA